jgi:hypothetical protein
LRHGHGWVPVQRITDRNIHFSHYRHIIHILGVREANAESLPFGDNEFDAVLSRVGVMFAPHHQRAADELVRVCRALERSIAK